MRHGYARRALSTFLLISVVSSGSALGQTRDEIREQNEQLYHQYQSGGAGDPSAVAPPMGGDAAASSPDVPPSGSGGSPGGGGNLVAQLLDRVTRLEEQNRELSGRVDELERNLQTQTAQLNKQMGDLTFAMQQGHPGAAGPGVDAAPAAAAPMVAPPPHPSRAAPRVAAAPATPPPGPRGAGAAYKLAAAYAAEGNYRQAALAYYDVYNRAPRGPLAPDALLHVSSSMLALGQNGAACEALSKVRAEFPTARGNVVRTAQALRLRARC